MSTGGQSAARGRRRELLFWVLASCIVLLLLFAYSSLHSDRSAANSGERSVVADEKWKAKFTINYCHDRVKALPEGSDEAQIGKNACAMMEREFVEKYGSNP